jgi:ethanolamine utilization protein EutN
MFLARVVGSVWSTVKWPELGGLKLLLVRPYSLEDLAKQQAPKKDLVVCADVLDAGVGDDVVIAYGHAARVAVSQVLGESERPNVPIDAAVVAVVDRVQVTLPEKPRDRG